MTTLTPNHRSPKCLRLDLGGTRKSPREPMQTRRRYANLIFLRLLKFPKFPQDGRKEPFLQSPLSPVVNSLDRCWESMPHNGPEMGDLQEGAERKRDDNETVTKQQKWHNDHFSVKKTNGEEERGGSNTSWCWGSKLVVCTVLGWAMSAKFCINNGFAWRFWGFFFFFFFFLQNLEILYSRVVLVSKSFMSWFFSFHLFQRVLFTKP